MSYRFLAPQLHNVADACRVFCTDQWGIGTSKIKTEEAVADRIGFVPTISAVSPEYYQVCIEVSPRAYNSTLDAFVLDCRNEGLPVKLYVAVPAEGIEGDFKADMARAKGNGVGLLEVTENDVVILQEAVPLSVTGVRPIQPKEFPSKYRQAISDAIGQFKNGSPVKAGSTVYDEVEGLTRRLAKRAQSAGWWTSGATPKFESETLAWAKLLKILLDRFDRKAAGVPMVTAALIARAMGITSHRNDAGHKPTSLKKLQERDRQLRTRFEAAVDLLRDFISATKPLKL